jgi:hypothetical protein
LFSYSNDLALVTEQIIRPYRKGAGGGALNSAYFFERSWPAALLQEMGNTIVNIKVVLSYFIEPNPGGRGAVSAVAYRSAGLRFDIKRVGESLDDFFGYINKHSKKGKLPERSNYLDRILVKKPYLAAHYTQKFGKELR